MMKKVEIDYLGQPTHQFPDDLIFDVLTWLPAKSLMRFKLVCKSWHALIRDPYFAESHHKISQTCRPDSSHLLFYMSTPSQSGRVYWSKFPIKPQWGIFPAKPHKVFSNQLPKYTFEAVDDGFTYIRHVRMGCTNIVNGLTCIRISPFQFELLNLTTKESVTLPKSETPHYPRDHDYSVSYYLGFDPTKKQYKVLFRGERPEYFIITFSSSTTMSWRKVESSPQLSLLGEENTSVDGAIYWNLKDDRGRRAVHYFEVGEEKFKVIPVNDQEEGEVDGVHQTEIGGKFTLVFVKRFGYLQTTGINKITLWRLIDRHDHVWVKSRIELPSLLIDHYQDLSFSGSTNTGNSSLLSLGTKFDDCVINDDKEVDSSQVLSAMLPFVVAVTAISALSQPSTFTWVSKELYAPALGGIMLSIGIRLSIDDFALAFKRPLPLSIGFIAQYALTPALGVLVAWAFGMSYMFFAGFVLMSSVAGVQLSSYASFLSKGDVALSIRLTSSSTIASVLVTPLLTGLLIGSVGPVDAVAMSKSILQM